MPLKRTSISDLKALTRIVVVSALAAALFVLVGFEPSRAEAPVTQALDAGQVIAQLSETLAAGRRTTSEHLKRLGFQAEVERMTTVDGTQQHTFSSRSMIESLYRRADLEAKGEGDRFLAVLYADASRQSAGVAKDPVFGGLRKFSAEDMKRPFKFSEPSAIRNITGQSALPQAVENAIGKLAEYYSGRNLAQARGLLQRTLRKDNFGSRNFDLAVSEEKTSLAVLRRLFVEGTPPPRIDLALREVLRQTMAQSAALGFDQAALDIIEELSKDLPPELDRYIQAEDNFESRKRQAAEAGRVGRPGKDSATPTSKDVLARIDAQVDQGNKGSPPSSQASSQGRPFDPPPPPPASAAEDPSNPKGGGGGGGAPARERARASNGAYEKYTGNTFGPIIASPSTGTRTTSTPRSYKVAIRSSRAARGIAIGGTVNSEISAKPIRAAWVANLKDDRFGRIFVEFSTADGKSQMSASRVMFADSFYAAVDALSGSRDNQAKFREGEILVLMSMDPDAQVTKDGMAKVQAEADELEKRMKKNAEAVGLGLQKEAAALQKRMADAKNSAELTKVLSDVESLKIRAASEKQKLEEQINIFGQEIDKHAQAVPRGIVIHPSIFGRELAWSAARVDFWFNQMDSVVKEAGMINGGKPLPDSLRKITFEGAVTWQFFEQDASIRLGEMNGRVRALVVASKGITAENVRGHFGISMFGKASGDGGDVDGLERLPKLEGEVQPLLDWLAVNHHDFLRLNDFSESFSLLRWLGSTKTVVMEVDMDGQGEAIATPDRVVIGVGPSAGR